jgi:hypothetical protein
MGLLNADQVLEFLDDLTRQLQRIGASHGCLTAYVDETFDKSTAGVASSRWRSVLLARVLESGGREARRLHRTAVRSRWS